MSLDTVKVGFIPLVDAAIPIMAADVGFAAAEGVRIELTREVSWSNIRDRLVLGHFDAAHLLAPLAIATSLGLGPIRERLSAPMALNLNGNAITLSLPLYDELVRHLDADLADPRATARAFAALVRTRRANGEFAPTLGMTFPFSTHNYLLRLWLASAGLEPDVDVRLAVVPPPFMVDAIEQGHVEGFCVGAPWNAVAVQLGIGRIVHLGVDLVRSCPEKVLAVRERWLGERPDVAARLLRACHAAARWLSDPTNRWEAAERLAARDRLDVRAEAISRSLEGRMPTGRGAETRFDADYLLFDRDGETRPDPEHALWLHAQMARWGQASAATAEEAAAVYRPDVYDAALGLIAAPARPRPVDCFVDRAG
ncbi:CmpA/NrtA family ABC transporter substrate-binding protein [Chenggangzhangella methanolivorans]|uniref:ABC transporter substrate-binding protein n=1 Tax=Chenggangzhangella methanolivorans TaxID=1437009 RepID=A0A9E6R8R0_9HYPH|nr:CmpA/NrtA family ABC transporter substrate-binding protein [Chenggangzhangella methanolivorans]QZN98692.1 ABC transporter substrate-binding protein [Chenggangzhangella methanolivorans]